MSVVVDNPDETLCFNDLDLKDILMDMIEENK